MGTIISDSSESGTDGFEIDEQHYEVASQIKLSVLNRNGNKLLCEFDFIYKFPQCFPASDSREIMMTSDTEPVLLKTSQRSTSSGPTTTVPTIKLTAHQSPCPQDEFQCTNGVCIGRSQFCDGVRYSSGIIYNIFEIRIHVIF